MNKHVKTWNSNTDAVILAFKKFRIYGINEDKIENMVKIDKKTLNNFSLGNKERMHPPT